MNAVNEMPSVLMILQDLSSLGGAEQQAQRLVHALQSQGVTVEIVTGCWNGQEPGCTIIDGIPVHYISTAGHLVSRRGGRRISRYVMLSALFNFLWRHRSKYDVLHFHESDFLVIAGILIRRLFKKRVITKMRNSGNWSDLRKVRKHSRGVEIPIIIDALRRADRTISLNEETTQELVNNGFQLGRIVYIANGIDVDEYIPRADYTFSTSPKLIFVGRLEPQKDVKTLLQALTLTSRSDVEVVILGDGPQRRFLKRLADDLGIRERVRFCGRVSGVKSFLHEADLFVLPSLSEGISNALLEAMACGMPCLVTDIPGNRAVITNGIDAYSFTPSDSTALASLITVLLADESLRCRLGQAARETVIRRFSIDVVSKAYLALYHQLASN